MGKLLTVVIPTYNMERYLRECLDSLLHVSCADETELLVVDDGSEDASGLIADEYEKRYQGIVRTIHKENGGHGSAINAGIESATGLFFKVVDSDDVVDSAAYEAYLGKLRSLANRGCDLVATPFSCLWQDAVKRSLGSQKKLKERKIEGTQTLERESVIPFEAVADKVYVRMHEWTIQTRILKEHRIILSEHSYYVDMQFIMFPVPFIKTICILEEAVYQYRLGDAEQSVSIKNMQKNREQHREVMRSLLRFFRKRKEAGDSEAVLSYLARGIAKMEENQVQIALSLPIGKSAKGELVNCEQELKRDCPAAYMANEKRSLWLLRRSNYRLYRVAAVAWRMMGK